MAENSAIQWTGSTWSPIRARVKANAVAIAQAKGYTTLVKILTATKDDGSLRIPAGKIGPHCEHVSTGCLNCYSETNNSRCLPANGTGLPFDRRSRDLVDTFVDEKILLQPLRWRKPRKIFVCSQTDLFAEFVTDEMIDRVFAVMALSPNHTFQVLTKRSDRMRKYLTSREAGLDEWPLPNAHLGVSVEDQEYADKRIPDLLMTPAEVRFVSYEPALGPIDFEPWLPIMTDGRYHFSDCSCFVCYDHRVALRVDRNTFLDWVIIGGESGPGARPFDIDWARQTIEQCKATGTPVFVKQLGAKPFNCLKLKDRKGGDMPEWSEDLRVRQFPAAPACDSREDHGASEGVGGEGEGSRETG